MSYPSSCVLMFKPWSQGGFEVHANASQTVREGQRHGCLTSTQLVPHIIYCVIPYPQTALPPLLRCARDCVPGSWSRI